MQDSWDSCPIARHCPLLGCIGVLHGGIGAATVCGVVQTLPEILSQ